ncbi:glycoside hydrolase family 43 protein [Nocardiopsis sp. RSe5-2]|uniref:Glycoside hydrolase family 43 protein n=1 Tax=Nocardiopsis endophytica TaxID=3018445 RepID=A0ABT4TXE5_9ACTN|nr:glycoside hydrolase family 43 protein [Nocardiopsis endophytica]MDA2809370.1 glycoside hydrolase family 43 protein [Nocardiopsis endophytica]
MPGRRPPRRSALAVAGLLAAPLVLTAPGAASAAPDEPSRGAAGAGYLFAYMTGERFADGEQVRFALSSGNDPLHWRELNGGDPVLTSDVGEEGVRDPFLVRSPEDGTYYLIATDLKMYGGGDWDEVQRHGSRALIVWESDDLVNWSEERRVEVSPPEAGNTWAPEAHWDAERGRFAVYWASKLYAEDDPDHTGDQHQRMMVATTEDFEEFSGAEVWHDPGHAVIDSTIVEHEGVYHRFTKDERGSSPEECGKFITAERSTDLLDRSWDFVADCIGRGSEGAPGIERGEGPTVFASNTEDKWYLFIDEYTGRGYVPFETTDLDSGEWTMADDYALPEGARHGSVVPVSAQEYSRLQSAWGPGGGQR